MKLKKKEIKHPECSRQMVVIAAAVCRNHQFSSPLAIAIGEEQDWQPPRRATHSTVGANLRRRRGKLMKIDFSFHATMQYFLSV